MAEIIGNESWDKHTGAEVEQYIKDRFINAEERVDSLEDGAVHSMSTNIIDDDNMELSLNNEAGDSIAKVTLPRGRSETGNSVSLSAIINGGVQYAKIGTTLTLTYAFDTYVGGEPSQDTGEIAVTIRRGSSTIATLTRLATSGGTDTIDLTPYASVVGKLGVYLTATVTFTDGTVSTRSTYAGVEVIDLTISTTFDPSVVREGGFSIPYNLIGTGDRSVQLHIDGGATYSSQLDTSSQSGSWNSAFSVPALQPGKHSMQLVALRGMMRSNSIYMDFLVAGSDDTYIGVSTGYEDGRIYPQGSAPMIEARQFMPVSFGITAWNKDDVRTDVTVYIDEIEGESLGIERGAVVTYTNTFPVSGDKTLRLEAGETEYSLSINVAAGDTDVYEVTPYDVKLDAAGRSNGETNPARWGEGSTFDDFDWKTNGWTGEVLRLTNGAKMTTGVKPFLVADALQSGLTIEVEFYVTNVMDRSMALVSCGEQSGEGFKGIRITADKAGCYTGKTKEVVTPEEDEHGDPIVNRTDVGVEMSFASGMWIKTAFAIHKVGEQRLMELYINGVRSKADVYEEGDGWTINKGLTIDSTGADIDVRVIRVYGRALEDHEMLENYIIDRNDPKKIKEIFDRNQVMTNNRVDYNKITDMGKGVMILIRADGIDPVNATNNKKTDFLVEKAYWYAPKGEGYGSDFVAENFNMRIQGTSSVKYPRKNYRLYLGKGNNPRLIVNGETSSTYAMRTDSVPTNLFCLKCDYSDSSMVMNTGGAKLYDKTMRKLGLLTPPQEEDARVRQAIDGIPCDLFVANDENLEGMTYIGQYNLNNEKSKSDKIFGMKGDWDCAIALESLNNGNPFCLFQPAGTAGSEALDEQLEDRFDAGFEFNYPEDVYWNEDVARSNLGEKFNAEENLATETQRTAIERLMGWIYDCVAASDGVTGNTMDIADPDYGTASGWSDESKAKWVSNKFKTEASQYFNVSQLLTYYIITDYWGSVDQRAKNILWRTWDGLKWFPTFYDGDTAMGVRNDSYLVYQYDMTRDTWDTDHSKFAYEGHDSWLWCLVLANFETELRVAAGNLRRELTFDVMDAMFTGEQQNNWCETLYNKSGEFKYIIPQIEGVPLYVDGNIVLRTYTNMYALTGNREAQRTLFLRERGKLLDARYTVGDYMNDTIPFYINRAAADTADIFTITANGRFSFGLLDDHLSWYTQPQAVADGDSVSISLSGAITTNSPHYLTGASHMGTLDLTLSAAHLSGNFNLTNCTLLRVLDAHLSTEGGLYPVFQVDSCRVLEEINVTNLTNVRFQGLNELTRLKVFKAGGTNIQSVSFSQGAPIETVILPDTITSLWLRGHRHLTSGGITLGGTSNITNLIITGCVNLDAMAVVEQCLALRRIRIDVSGKISLDILERLSTCSGYDSRGNECEYPALVGNVWLDRCATVERLAELNEIYEELEIRQCPYSHYWFADEETDPANITNEENKTGWAYPDNKFLYKPVGVADELWLRTNPNGYTAAGHVLLLRDRFQPCLGRIKQGATSSIMEIRFLSKDDYTKYTDGTTADITGAEDNGQDVFMYIPRYWYKGLNEYKQARKHFFLSSSEECPASSYNTSKIPLSELTGYSNTATSWEMFAPEQELTDESVMTAEQLIIETNYVTYKVDVEGWRQIRFPTRRHSYTCCVFSDENNKVLAYHVLTMNTIENNPIDFDETMACYDFRNVPTGAKWCWFTCRMTFQSGATVPNYIVLTDSDELEALEPDWVEHKPELIGIFKGGYLKTDNKAQEGIRSLKGRVTTPQQNSAALNSSWVYDSDGRPTLPIPQTNMDEHPMNHLNLCLVRGSGYSAITYESTKNLDNLFMVYSGTRDPISVYGARISYSYTTGVDATSFRDTSYNTSNGNCIWGIEGWLAHAGEVYEGIGRAFTSYASYLKNRRTGGNNASVMVIRRQDGTDSVLRYRQQATALSSAGNTIARVWFGRYCDIIKSSSVGLADNNYCYTDFDSAYNDSNSTCLPIRSGHNSGGYGLVSMRIHSAANNWNFAFLTGVRIAYYGDFIIKD